MIICEQCRRQVVAHADDWVHADGTPRCAPGTYDAIRMLLTVRWAGWLDRPWAG